MFFLNLIDILCLFFKKINNNKITFLKELYKYHILLIYLKNLQLFQFISIIQQLLKLIP